MASLVPLAIAPTQAAAAIDACWRNGDAVVLLDPRAPQAEVARQLEALDVDGPVADGVALVVATSGTTGEPRGVEITHAALEAASRAVDSVLGRDDADRWLCCLPVHGIAGLAILTRSRYTGVPVEVHDAFSIEAVSASLAAGANLISLVPTTLIRLLDAGAPLERARRVLLGGGPVPPGLRERARAAGVELITTYGLTETCGGCVYDGRPLPGVEIALAPPPVDRADPAHPWREGAALDHEILLRGPMLMRGYRSRPELTAAALDADGWLHTGDAGCLTAAGRLQVVDRLKDLVVSGGVNVSPTEVERVLADTPGVKDVCVTGRADAEWGERVVAHVVPVDAADPPTLEGLRAHARERLAVAKLPRELVLVASIPRTGGGKVLRRLLSPGGSSPVPPMPHTEPDGEMP